MRRVIIISKEYLNRDETLCARSDGDQTLKKFIYLLPNYLLKGSTY